MINTTPDTFYSAGFDEIDAHETTNPEIFVLIFLR